MAKSLGLGRPPESKNRIVEEFRTRIATGELHPGSRFPTRSEIELHYGAGRNTVQRALESLKEDGFICVHGRKGGTFVADNPPHLSRYAVVFPHPGTVGSFWNALSREVGLISQQRPDCQLVPYFGVNGGDDEHDESETFLRLRQQVVEHRVAGLIFTSDPHLVKNTPLVDEPGIPRVAIMDPTTINLPVVWADFISLLTKALDELKAQGHHRIAFLQNTTNATSELHALIDDLLRERGMETRPYWCQAVSVLAPSAARSCVNLLMHCHEIPDALVICDDNLVESATAGLQDAHYRLPDGFEVIAHCNFPYPTPCQFPARRLGFDIRQILQLCVENINAQRRGETVAQVTRLTAHFETEVASISYR